MAGTQHQSSLHLGEMDYPIDRKRKFESHPGRVFVLSWIEESLDEYMQADGKSSRAVPSEEGGETLLRSKKQIIEDILVRLREEKGGNFKRKENDGWQIVTPRDAKQQIAARFTNAIRKKHQTPYEESPRQGNDSPKKQKFGDGGGLQGDNVAVLASDNANPKSRGHRSATNQDSATTGDRPLERNAKDAQTKSPSGVTDSIMIEAAGAPASPDDTNISSAAVSMSDHSWTVSSSHTQDSLPVEELVSTMSLSPLEAHRSDLGTSSHSEIGSFPPASTNETAGLPSARTLALPELFEISTTSTKVASEVGAKFKPLSENIVQDNTRAIEEAMESIADHSLVAESGAIMAAAGDLDESSGIDVLVGIMKRYAFNERVQSYGCLILGNLSVNEERLLEISSCGGIQLVLKAMKTFPLSEEVHQNACLALRNLSRDPNSCDVMARDGGIASLIKGMKDFPTNDRLQDNSCMTLGNLAWDENVAVIIAEQGGIEMVLQALKNFPFSERIQESGCAALASLALSDEGNRAAIGKAGGIGLVIRAMKAYSINEELQDNGCNALGALAEKNIGNTSQIVANGGTELIVEAIKNFPDNFALMLRACLALESIGSTSALKT